MMMRPNFWLMRGSNRKHVGGSVGRQNQNLELQSGLSICQIPIYRLDIVNACDTTKERERERGVEKKRIPPRIQFIAGSRLELEGVESTCIMCLIFLYAELSLRATQTQAL